MTRLTDGLAKAAEALATIAFIGFFVFILAQIGYRYLGLSLVFSEELARLLNLYVVFLGLVVVTVRHGHIRIDILDRMLGNGPLTAALYRIQLVLTFIFLASVAWGSWSLTAANWPYPLATLHFVPKGAIYLAPFLGAAVGAVVSLLRLAQPVPPLGVLELEEIE
ncbi:TRAP transporter small permease subunit [Acuticoccus sp. MNP-M23]|uniref:TRAP transporter small permease n=1 Tax=Acuticoccus sp. MNP-M23 TaxID=3072793 RepID=UPI002814E939|nr:TRAP transporter small permease subunit [Acuticoccus sp. MNP-M23]WMS41921.1 TRAP transporter small permease subunit [Acuticoccus sp. MNP-M23]